MEPYKSVTQWIDEQEWSDAVKAEAHAIHASRCAKDLNPMTRGQWIKWAASQLVT